MENPAYTLYSGFVERCYQIASGIGVYNPYNDSTLRMQVPKFRERGFDLGELVPGYFLGTINVNLGNLQLRLDKPDYTFEKVKWADIVEPETYSFAHCAIAFRGVFYTGLLYYPHPETKPKVNAHHFNRIEIIAPPVPGLKYNDHVSVMCRDNVFKEFK